MRVFGDLRSANRTPIDQRMRFIVQDRSRGAAGRTGTCMSRFPTMDLQPTGLDHRPDANSTKTGPRVPSASRVPRTHRLRGGRVFGPGCESQYFRLQIENCELKIEQNASSRVAEDGMVPPRSHGRRQAAGEPQVRSASGVPRTHRLRGGRVFGPGCESQYFRLQIENCKLKIEDDSRRCLPGGGGQV